MDWQKLITTERFSINDDTSPIVAQYQNEGEHPVVNPLHKDVDRVVFSSPFRRLQGKTQVFMFPETDYVRNRLTHTLEVVSIGRLLATAVFREMYQRTQNDHCIAFKEALAAKGLDVADVVESVAAACHAHDLGNAPFGHIGEHAIRSWFKTQPGRRKKELKHCQKIGKRLDDYIWFDGNPQTFRIVTKLTGWKAKGGFNLVILV